MIIELTKIANAGLYPASDVMEPLIGISGGIIPIDIDIIALHYSKKRPVNWREIGLKIRKNIYDTVDSYRERKQLLQVARSIAREEIIPYLK